MSKTEKRYRFRYLPIKREEYEEVFLRANNVTNVKVKLLKKVKEGELVNKTLIDISVWDRGKWRFVSMGPNYDETKYPVKF